MIDPSFGPHGLQPADHNGQLVDQMGGNRSVRINVGDGVRLAFAEPNSPVGESHIVDASWFT
jgi:hypothetical protein